MRKVRKKLVLPKGKQKGKQKKRKKIKRTKRTVKKRGRKKTSPLILIKLPEGPIISARAENGWEAWQTFNPGVILLDNKVHILYRAIGEDGISRLGYAISGDGLKIDERLFSPVYQHQLKK